MRTNKNNIIQFIFGIFIFGLIFVLLNNLIINLIRNGMGLSFEWLLEPSGFALAETAIPFNPSNSYLWALFVGWLNSLKIIFYGLIIATVFGTLIGLGRISNNLFVRIFSDLYIKIIRQIPLLIQLLFWYFVAFLSLNDQKMEPFGYLISFSRQGIELFGIEITVEFASLLIGLSVFTAAYIAEVVRGGIGSVPLGQWEAYRSLGVSETLGIYKIIIPQALPAIIPGLTSQYLNLAKNSTLAIAIGYTDLYAVSDTTITQTGRAIEGFFLLLLSFLMLNLLITQIMEFLNRIVLKYNKLN